METNKRIIYEIIKAICIFMLIVSDTVGYQIAWFVVLVAWIMFVEYAKGGEDE